MSYSASLSMQKVSSVFSTNWCTDSVELYGSTTVVPIPEPVPPPNEWRLRCNVLWPNYCLHRIVRKQSCPVEIIDRMGRTSQSPWCRVPNPQELLEEHTYRLQAQLSKPNYVVNKNVYQVLQCNFILDFDSKTNRRVLIKLLKKSIIKLHKCPTSKPQKDYVIIVVPNKSKYQTILSMLNKKCGYIVMSLKSTGAKLPNQSKSRFGACKTLLKSIQNHLTDLRIYYLSPSTQIHAPPSKSPHRQTYSCNSDRINTMTYCRRLPFTSRGNSGKLRMVHKNQHGFIPLEVKYYLSVVCVYQLFWLPFTLTQIVSKQIGFS
ncbi:hypothetical protein AGLY_006759 [Aphis glycines]|uniref:Uncharacterized protein n=1 Tax=Aphis glycines TaxID=307491 RepID=A0A6G0TQN1_APHGL|nr:hypothetical protein AGLY_006759 [Aphis glycines]